MPRRIKDKNLPGFKAQSILEYAVVIACIVAALIAMQFYIKRGMEGRLRSSSDTISEEHYSSNNINATTVTKLVVNTTVSQKQVVVKDENGQELLDPSSLQPMRGLETEVDTNETLERTGSEKVGF